MPPPNLVPRAEPLGIFGTPSHSSKILQRGSVFSGKEVFSVTSPLTAPGESETQVSLDKAPFSMETRGWTRCCLPVCPHFLPHKVFRFFPFWQTGGVGLGGLPSHLQSCRAEGIAWRKLGVWKRGKGWSGLRPLVLIKVRRCKSIKNNLLPPRLLSQWCRSRSLSRCLSCSRFLSWK